MSRTDGLLTWTCWVVLEGSGQINVKVQAYDCETANHMVKSMYPHVRQMGYPVANAEDNP